MKIHDCKQGSPEWQWLRAGVVTASEADNLVTPLWKVKEGEGVKTYLATKLAEWWCGPLLGFYGFAAEQGQILQQEAIDSFEFETGQKISEVGFISSDDGLCGCSPDGLIRDGFGIEIKCLQPTHHVQCLLRGGLPKEFAAQVQFSMFVTGFARWKFFGYHRRLPTISLDVWRDPDAQEAIKEAVEEFLDRFKEGQDRLIEINGGPPPKHQEDNSPHPDYHIDEPAGITS